MANVEPGLVPDFAAAFLERLVEQVLRQHAERLSELSQSIWEKPELAFKEFHACGLLTSYLKKEGYAVQTSYGGLETAFLGTYETSSFDSSKHPTVAVLCEYDALPEIGHACGHNLIAEAGLGTFIAVCEVLKTSDIQGRVYCMGTPAEEAGSGKVQLLNAGAFKGVDFAMMIHPCPVDILEPAILGVVGLKVEFHGKSAHASCGPWEAVNALDAAVAAYNNISMLRQQLEPACQVHMTIMNGGVKPNIIPDYSLSEYYIRAPTEAHMKDLKKRVFNCLEAAALATGCKSNINFTETETKGLMSNQTMLSVYGHYGKKHGMFFPPMRPTYGSTDMGNVSVEVPSIHPAFGVGAPGMEMIHTRAFQTLTGRPEAHKAAQRGALAMSMTALNLLIDPDFRHKVRKEFELSKQTFVGSAGFC
ncbi:hypothetical protein RvY_07722 [Ramazzottius varieornatus]|uniref:Peptidase M20 domain-containing protein 2 n=1 Tax=Ramazzottius varieornatus TaxID=947166 RepID=A0A1D1V3H0_RAMVA|nr:hypothetical protein RvY_07722 [Ramazzottius varieornatus]